MRRAHIAGLVVAGMVLSGCSAVHPGSAAVVGDRKISMSSVNDLSRGACLVALGEGSSTGSDPSDNATHRANALGLLVLTDVAENLAKDNGVTVGQQAVSDQDLSALKAQYGSNFPDVKAYVLKRSRYYSLLEGLGRFKLGAKADGASQDTLMQAGYEWVGKQVAKDDPDVDPRFGSQTSATGSLSVAPANSSPNLSALSACKA